MKHFIYTLMILVGSYAMGQGAHYSGVINHSQIVNSALLGNEKKDNKIFVTNRRQWSDLGFAYNTTLVGLSKQINKLTLGGIYQNNNSGRASINEDVIAGAISYSSQWKSNIKAVFAFELGTFNQSFNPNELAFENQYSNELGYNPNASNGESFTSVKLLLPYFGLGFNVTYLLAKAKVNAGIAFKNLISNKERYLEQNLIENHKKINMHISHAFFLDSKNSLKNMLFLSSKIRAKEFMVMTEYERVLSNDLSLFLGIGYRVNDAAIGSVGLRRKNILVNISYDQAMSKLSEASATELNVSYSFNRLKNRKKLKEEVTILPVVEEKKAKDNDFDNDGIVNSEDQCPYEYGIRKYKGCPFMDADKDGITDDVDICPTLFGAGNQSGCPDFDRDGISDNIDASPLVEDIVEEIGCSATIDKSKKREKKMNISDTLIVYFTENSAELLAKYKLSIIQFIKNISESHLLIINGHTNDNGPNEYNKNLGELRSKSVINFLQKLGINNNIIVPTSYGENKPYLSNESTIGKTLNRRVEIIHLLK